MKKIKYSIIILSIFIVAIIGIASFANAASSYNQYVKTGIDQFPDSYKTKLQQLSSKYPNWKFQAYYTGISWDDLIQKERDDSVHRNRVTATAPMSWKHCDFVDDGWACASDSAVKYYLDPRNFLNDTQIFQFVETSYNEKAQTLSAIQNSVKGTFLDKTITCKDLNNNDVTMSYSQIIIEAAKRTNISAFYIKSKIIQEVGSSGSGSVTGTYPRHEGYYNFFNYGAYDDGDDIANGLNYAKDKGWDSQYKAIVGGAELIGKYYISQGQNTAYFNKWDVVGTKILKDGESQTVNSSDMFWHQYMTNIQDPTSQSSSTRKLYESCINSEITFIIPVYNNMPASNPMPKDIAVQSISLNRTSWTIDIDQREELTVTFNPTDATNKNVIWTSSNPDVVRVWEGGFRGLKEGTSVITARTQDGGKVATCTVIVKDPNKRYVKDVQFEQDSYFIQVDEAVDIPYTFTPITSENAEFSWTSTNPDVLRVYWNRMRGLKPGTAQIIVRTLDGTFEKRINVTVGSQKEVKVQNMQVQGDYKIKVDEAVDIPYSYTPTNATNAEFSWTSTNPDVLRVYWNRMRGLKPGTAEIIVKTLDGTFEKRINVTVESAGAVKVQNMQVQENYKIKVDEAVDIPYSYTPTNATNAEFSWTSTNPDVLRVYWNRMRGLKPGTAQIIIRTLDGTFEKRINVTVESAGAVKVQNIQVQENYTISVDEAIDIPYSYTPTNATNAEFSWTSTNPDVLRVYWNRMRGLKAGTTQIIVKTLDGTFEKRINVTVK